MKFIPPLEIASKIMTLIEESNKELILISPYVELSKWNKMKKCLDRAVKRGVSITFVARKNAKQDLSFLQHPNINLILVNDLHAKLYLNEKYAIVTSQNIVYYSDVNSIDIAYKTVNNDQRNELIEFIDKYVFKIEEKKEEPKSSIKIIDEEIDIKKVDLTSVQLDKLSMFLGNTYNDIKFTTTRTYVFSNKLIPFSDVIIDSFYTVKMKKFSLENIDPFINEVLAFDLNLKNDFNLQLSKTHNKFYYLYFIPINNFEIEDLINDYHVITKAILESHYLKEIKYQKETEVKFTVGTR